MKHATLMGLLALAALGTTPAFAASANSKTVPDYSQTERGKVPEEFKFRVSDIYPSEQAWRTELEAVRKLADEFDGLSRDWTSSPQKMATLLERMDEFQQRGGRLYAYASLQGDMDLADTRFQKMKGELQHLFVTFGAKIAFIQPDILALGAEKTAAYVKDEPRLAPYKVTLERILRAKDHVLPTAQQQIATMSGLFAGVSGKASNLLNDVDIPRPEITLSDGTKVMLNTAAYNKLRASGKKEDRRLAMASFWNNQKRYENTFAALMDAGMKQHLFEARIHNFPTCLDSALFENDIPPSVYNNLIKTVRENLTPLHRLIKVRQRLLGLDKMYYGDVYAPAVASVQREFPYEEARDLVLKAMIPLGDEYTTVLNKAFTDRWVDVYPNKGKQSGAYSSGVFGVHPFVKMNYDGTISNVSTLAHELGHSMHSHFSFATQPYANAEYPIFLAEIASTFNEKMLMDQLLKSNIDDEFKLFVLDGYLERFRATLYRQTLFADFELAMHERVEQGQALTADWLDAKYLELTRLYYGHDKGVMNVEDYIQTEWSGIPHFYRNFYVFQYSTGIVASMALANQVQQQGEPARQRYMTFLKAGCSKFPLEILKDAGVDMSTPAPVVSAIQAFDGMIGEMEKIVDRLEAKKKANN